MIPYLVYSRIAEPVLNVIFQMYLVPAYERILHTVPFSAPLFKVILYSGSKFMTFVTSVL